MGSIPVRMELGVLMDFFEDLTSFWLLLCLLGSGALVTIVVLLAFVNALTYLEDVDG